MSFTDYSSIFELLCGYNFVNAVNGSDALKFLDFTIPVKKKVESLKVALESALDKFLGDHGDGPRGRKEEIQSVFQLKKESEDLLTRIERHGVRTSNLYLVAGIFGFFILLFSGMDGSYTKNNSLVLLAVGTFVLYGVFLVCDFTPDKARKKKRRKLGLLLLLGTAFAVLLFLKLGWLGRKAFLLQDNFYCIGLSLVILLCLLFLARSWFVRRKSHKALFIIAFMLLLLIPDTSAFYSWFYDVADKGYPRSVLILTIVFIVLLMAPFAYDLLTHVGFESSLRELEADIRKANFKTTVEEEHLNKSDGDINPIRRSPRRDHQD